MRYLLLIFFCYLRSFAQPNVHIQGHFDGFPSSLCQVFVYNPLNIHSQELTAQARTDESGCFKADFRLESPQKVTVECLGYRVDFLLKPSDTLYFFTPNRSHFPIVKGPTARLHTFLYQSLLFGQDSLLRRPLFQHMSLDDYSFVVDDLWAQSQERYQREQDTANVYINTYVFASLEGQRFLRKRTYLQSKGESLKNEALRLKVTDDAALISEMYQEALYSQWLGYLPNGFMNRNVVFQMDSTVWEGRYAAIYEGLRKFPKTRELLLAKTVQRAFSYAAFSSEKEYSVPAKLLERFKEDFPESPYSNALHQEFPARLILPKTAAPSPK
ncbi:hypothetical protein [Runella slithyformis]|uniref:Uncharacterized protein n=1 Tax=Runella slithyformis (strain ATCC 29530 / DSM 19594 / LMG 11500 / NCIMB 11436 / LSU 4) TaxID=761193 RepID=A0A7U3ZHT2_RUNSL|nr:hypothetical protein [Runella slithyformis]AEI47392.1 hypothetical protein Runsl_0961 [Runella slithyformis DSM 19594]